MILLKSVSIMLMIQTEIAFFLFLLGAAMGSFAGAMAWRLHTKRNMVNDRSECEHCHHKLSVMDLLPIVSWLVLGGKCRYCRAQISPLALFSEIALAVIFTISFLFWPFGFASWQAEALFAIWLVYMVILDILTIYDIRWMLLPDKLVVPLIIIALLDAALRVSLMQGVNFGTYLMYMFSGLIALPGIYGLLYVVSKGKWVGLGDIKLGVFMAIVLGWQKSFLVLCLGNILGLAIILPGLILGKLNIKSRIPFGPFLILGFILAGLFGDSLINWYLSCIGL